MRNSLDNAIAAIGTQMGGQLGRRASQALSQAVKDRVFFVSAIHKPLPPAAKETRAEFNTLVDALEAACLSAAPTELRPVYEKRSLSLHPASHGGLSRGIGGSPGPHASVKQVSHWTRIKALARRPARLESDEYDTLRPVADLIRELSTQIRAFLVQSHHWEPAHGAETMRQAVMDSIARELYAHLHTLARTRLIRDQLWMWEAAYRRCGTGSAKERAYDLEMIYTQAGPIVSELRDLNNVSEPRDDEDFADEFLRKVIELIRDAIQAKGGLLR